MNPYRWFCYLSSAALIACLSNSPVAAQTIEGSVNGIVTDVSGAIVPSASVILENLDRDERRVTASNGVGAYSISSVLPGRYSLKVTAPGFKAFVIPEFQVVVNQTVVLNAALTIGETTQVTEVYAEAAALNAADATIGTVIQSRQIVQLPLNGRQFTQLILLAPGAAPIQSGQQNAFTISLGGGGISPAVNGMRPQMNNFTIDGVDNNMRFTNTYAVSPPPDAIQEFNVEGHQTDPAASFAAGANVNLMTRSGTHDLHGSAWEFLRNDKLSAQNFIDNIIGNKKLPYRQNQYGFAFGGPVVIPRLLNGRKSRTYFFTYYEGFKARRTSTTFASVPNQTIRGGDLSSLMGSDTGVDGQGRPVAQRELFDPKTTQLCAACSSGFIRDPFPGNIIPKDRIHPLATAILQALYPQPNQTGNVNNLALAQSRKQDSDQFGTRVDHSLSDSRRLYGRFSWYHTEQLSPSGLPSVVSQNINRGFNGVGHYTWVFNPSFLADFQIGYNRASIPSRNLPFDSSLSQNLGPNLAVQVAGGYLPVDTVLTSSLFSSASFTNFDLAAPDYSYQYNVDFRKVASTHTVALGFRLMHWRHIVGNQGNATLTYSPSTTNQPGIANTGEAFASFLLGLPTASNYQYAAPLQTYGNIYVGYVGDSWKVNRHLTIDLGLQYVFATPPLVKDNKISLFDYPTALTRPNATDFAFAYIVAGMNPITGAGPNATRSSIVLPDKNNFAPRAAIAYSITEKTIIRSGFGVFYDYNTNLIQNSIRITFNNWPYSLGQQISGQNITTLGPMTPILNLDNPFVKATPTPPVPRNTINRFNRDPYAMQWNVGVERLLRSDMILSVNYVGAGARRLPITVQDNIAPAGVGPINPRRPLPNSGSFFSLDNIGNSSYHALQSKLEKRFSKGLSVLNSFTWSKSLDAQSDPNTADIDYVYNIRLSRGPSDFNLPVIEVFSFTYQLPFGTGRGSGLSGVKNVLFGGWELSGIFTARSGLPYFISTGQDNENTGNIQSGFSERANQIADPTPAGFHQTRVAWFDKNAFQVPSFGTIGNMSRNSLRGPAFQTLSSMIGKTFSMTERYRLEFRAEAFNTLNHTNFGLPVSNLLSGAFGQIRSAGVSRDIQVALKFHW